MAKNKAKERRAHFQSIERSENSQGTCADIGKQMFYTRRAAKKYGKKAFPGEKHLSAYPCGDHFHFGHLPDEVVAGKVDRSVLSSPRRPNLVVVPQRDPIEFAEPTPPARIPSPAELAARSRVAS
ncbi:hypothetical protein [Aeromicrobium sp. 179-A 4D2 NHS]|uniref:hypothetical protein n=1 Tax=Aeromicrobium sp. 179-A 4D2 NHS TaxID=3142375 RepID=UPI0039A18BDD